MRVSSSIRLREFQIDVHQEVTELFIATTCKAAGLPSQAHPPGQRDGNTGLLPVRWHPQASLLSRSSLCRFFISSSVIPKTGALKVSQRALATSVTPPERRSRICWLYSSIITSTMLDIAALARPAPQVLLDLGAWRHQSGGLAVGHALRAMGIRMYCRNMALYIA